MNAYRTCKLAPVVVRGQLDARRWYTTGQIVDVLRQSGPLAFTTVEEYRAFQFACKKAQYRAVHTELAKMRKAEMIESALGDDSGREVRVYRSK